MSYFKTFRSSTTLVVSTFFIACLLCFGASSAAADSCSSAAKELQASYDVVQGKGGLWGFLEQRGELKEKSILGLQADSKIQRGVVIFNEMCKSSKTPDMSAFKSLQDVIGDARMVFNLNERTPAKKILEAVTQVNQKADKVLASLEQ